MDGEKEPTKRELREQKRVIKRREPAAPADAQAGLEGKPRGSRGSSRTSADIAPPH